MLDYFPFSNNRKLPEPDPEEDQEEQQTVVVDFVYNTHEDGKGKTVAFKLSLQLPVKFLGYPHSQ